MDARVATLEEFAKDAGEKLTRVDVRLEATASKADLADAKAELVKWIVGTAIGLGVAGITVMTFVLNNASPKAAPASQPPIIINVPAAAAPASAPR